MISTSVMRTYFIHAVHISIKQTQCSTSCNAGCRLRKIWRCNNFESLLMAAVWKQVYTLRFMRVCVSVLQQLTWACDSLVCADR